MTKTDLDVCLQCLTICVKQGLIAVESLVEVGIAAKKLKSAMDAMGELDVLRIYKDPQTDAENLPDVSQAPEGKDQVTETTHK